jgi:hypothetical protein
MIASEKTIKNILIEILFENHVCESQEDNFIVEYIYHNLLESKFLYGEPISTSELRKLLRQKILNFEFIKLNGDVRPARGTTMLKYIPQSDHPKGIRPSSEKVATFFDLDKKEWRSVSNRSKEIVLKKDEEKNRPIIVVKDKGAKTPEEKEKKYAEKVAHVKDVKRIGPEPEDELEVGDTRNFLNRNNKNIQIKILRILDDGSVYAETTKEKTVFYIPTNKIVNIGEIVPPEDVVQPLPPETTMPLGSYKQEEKPIVNKPVTPQSKAPSGEKAKVIKLIPKKTTVINEPEPEEEDLDNKEDSEELFK